MPAYHLFSSFSVWSFFRWYASSKQSQNRKELQEIVFQLMGKDQRKSLFVLAINDTVPYTPCLESHKNLISKATPLKISQNNLKIMHI